MDYLSKTVQSGPSSFILMNVFFFFAFKRSKSLLLFVTEKFTSELISSVLLK